MWGDVGGPAFRTTPNQAEIKSVECPKCQAAAGYVCVGKRDGSSHRERQIAARTVIQN